MCSGCSVSSLVQLVAVATCYLEWRITLPISVDYWETGRDVDSDELGQLKPTQIHRWPPSP